MGSNGLSAYIFGLDQFGLRESQPESFLSWIWSTNPFSEFAEACLVELMYCITQENVWEESTGNN